MYGWYSETMAQKHPDSIVMGKNEDGETIECTIMTSFSGPQSTVEIALKTMYPDEKFEDLIALGEVEPEDAHKKRDRTVGYIEGQDLLDSIKEHENERGF